MRWRWAALALVALAVGAWVWRRPAGRAGPNVVFVVWDTTRADRMSLYGATRPTTPELDRWAAEGTVYTAARSPGIWTLPAHASMFTGNPPPSTGADERWLWLDSANLTMAEHFSASGYRTMSWAANALLCGETQLTQGFDVVLNSWKGRMAPLAARMTRAKIDPTDRSNELAPGWRPPSHGAHNAEWARAIYKDAAPLAVETTLRWIDEADDGRPFFAFVNLMEAHTPRVPSRESRTALLDDDTLARGLATDAAHIRLHFYNFGKESYDDAQLDAIRGVYDAALRDLDRATAHLVEGLRSRGLLEDTIVVLTADHGENLGDHHLFNHRFSLADSLVHVPLVVRYPKGLAPGRVSHPVSTMDLFATLTDLAGLPTPSMVGQSLRGGAIRPIVSFLARPLEREIDSVRGVYPEVDPTRWLRSGAVVAIDRQTMMRFDDGTVSFYDLETDPGQVHDLGAAAAPTAFHEALDAFLGAMPHHDPGLRTPRDRPAAVRAGQEELRAQLEAIGYATPAASGP